MLEHTHKYRTATIGDECEICGLLKTTMGGKNGNKNMKQEIYICRIKCSNCNYGYPNNDDMEIPKGTTEKEWSTQTECPRCGCKGTLFFYGGCYERNY